MNRMATSPAYSSIDECDRRMREIRAEVIRLNQQLAGVVWVRQATRVARVGDLGIVATQSPKKEIQAKIAALQREYQQLARAKKQLALQSARGNRGRRENR